MLQNVPVLLTKQPSAPNFPETRMNMHGIFFTYFSALRILDLAFIDYSNSCLTTIEASHQEVTVYSKLFNEPFSLLLAPLLKSFSVD